MKALFFSFLSVFVACPWLSCFGQFTELVDGDFRFCNGCFVKHETGVYLLTACHCQDGRPLSSDLCLVQAPLPEDFDPGNCPSLGVAVPGAATCQIVREGQVLEIGIHLRELGFGGYLVSDWTPVPGDSGSPVFQEGRVVGVVSFRFNDRPGGGVAIWRGDAAQGGTGNRLRFRFRGRR